MVRGSSATVLEQGKTNEEGSTALAPGFRFHPTDEELVSYYLKRKVCGKPVRFTAICEADIYKSEPWDLPSKSRLKTRDQEWYFFSALDKKYGNGARMNRATGKGYWKATGNDRVVRHQSRTVGMKKTLVFHSGRAPGGKRTDWVMHEYRLVDEELEKFGITQGGGFVLCRVFQKSGIGPPNGSRYAPFVEEEWDDGGATLVPGVETPDDGITGDDTEQNDVEQAEQLDLNVAQHDSGMHTESELPTDTQSPPRDSQSPPTDPHNSPTYNQTQIDNQIPLTHISYPSNSHGPLLVCKTERVDDYPLTNPEPFLRQYKRRRHLDSDFNHSNVFDNLIRATQESCAAPTSSSTTTISSTTINLATNITSSLPSALVEFSLIEPIEPKDCPIIPQPSFDSSSIDASLPPKCVKLLKDLQEEIHKISVERETLRLEMASAQAMINILQSRIDHLNKENDDLKRMARQ